MIETYGDYAYARWSQNMFAAGDSLYVQSYDDEGNNMVIVILTNKLHSKMEYGDFAGKRFQTSWLGFVPEILEIGLNGEEVDPGIWASMAGDMAAVAKRTLDDKGITDHDHPLWKAYESLLAAQQKVS